MTEQDFGRERWGADKDHGALVACVGGMARAV